MSGFDVVGKDLLGVASSSSGSVRIAAFAQSIRSMTQVSAKITEQVVETLKPISASSMKNLNTSQKVALISLTCGGVALYFVSHWLRRKRKSVDPNRSIRAIRRARKISYSSRAGSTSAESTLKRGQSPHQGYSSSYNWMELQKQSSICTSDKDSITSAATLVDGTALTPQQLGLMGMEALETVVGYWEDALAAYEPQAKLAHPQARLMTPEEAKFMKKLENILEQAYQLQETSETLFIHQQSILNRKTKDPFLTPDEGDFFSRRRGSISSKNNLLLSVSSVDNESFVSAQDTIADLRDFDDLNDVIGDADASQELYLSALRHLEEKGIPYRTIRTDFVGCENDAEYLAKLHCLRQAFTWLMSQEDIKNWWIEIGRQILGDLMSKCDKDPKDFLVAFDDLVEYLSIPEHIDRMADELKSRNVQCTNFYDVALDYILIDSFEDLESPPSSVLAVMKNRWLSNGFKESALQTAIWSVLKAKRRMLKYPDGFKAQFYNLSEILTPALAWGFFGSDEALNSIMSSFKDQALGFIQDLYAFDKVRYTKVDILGDDIMKLARSRLEHSMQHFEFTTDE